MNQADAVAHVKKLLTDSRSQIEANAQDVSLEWKDNVLAFSFTAQGQHMSGTLTVLDREFDAYVKLPLALRLFEGRIQKMIEGELQKALGK